MEQNTKNKQTDNSAPDQAVGVERMVRVRYYAWLSSRGERKELKKDGVVFAGLVQDVPKEFEQHLHHGETRQYCVISKAL